MMLSTSDLSYLSEVAKSAALMAGEYIQSQFEADYVKQSKVGGDTIASQVVTEVDFKAQEIILDCLNESIVSYDLGLLTEETTDDHSRLQKDYFWCIDPLDGTMPFTELRAGYAVSIALISKAGKPAIGAVYIPDTEDCYVAYAGSGVYLNDHWFVHDTDESENLHFYMDSSFLDSPQYEWVKRQFQEFIKESGSHIHYHSDFGGVRNAIGVISSSNACYFKFPKKENGCGSSWDYAATHLLMEELGLHVSNIDGDRMNLNNPDTTFMNREGILYATNQKLAEFVMELAKNVKNQ
ncbi:MAG: inositol monophosphatase family protein [Bacteroidota bacterium]